MEIVDSNHEISRSEEGVARVNFPVSVIGEVPCLDENGKLCYREQAYGIGRHLLVDFYGCKSDALHSISAAEEFLDEVCRESRLTLLGISLHKFSQFGDSPSGISGVAIVAESYIGIHTWPELGIATIDYHVCEIGAVRSLGVNIVESIGRKLQSDFHDFIILDRGTHAKRMRIEKTKEEING